MKGCVNLFCKLCDLSGNADTERVKFLEIIICFSQNIFISVKSC